MSWTILDLRSKVLTPKVGVLVALRLRPKNGSATYYRDERFDIGRFKTDSYNAKSRKLWWHGAHGVENPTRLRKHYEIWWYAIQEF